MLDFLADTGKTLKVVFVSTGLAADPIAPVVAEEITVSYRLYNTQSSLSLLTLRLANIRRLSIM